MYLCDLLMVCGDCEIEILDKNGKLIASGSRFRDIFPISNQKVLNVSVKDYGTMYITINCEVNDENN